jgi:two-component system, sensor histidine kinase PdtaS
LITAAFKSGAIGRESEEGQVDSAEDGDISVEAVPVRYNNNVVAVLTHQTAFAARKASPLERAYLDCAGDLLHMLSEGTFPNVGELSISRSSPRVGDGFIRLDVAGVVVFASPNALSAYHRMGLTAELEGQNLVAVTRPLISDPFEAQELAEHVRDSLVGGSSMRMEVDAGGAAVLLRTMPLVVHGEAAGAAVLIRDVTEIKRRDRALLSKDATIREIHHRVKNNLQTISSLLRLQGRRLGNKEARTAIEESVRRIASIALVHEILSREVGDDVPFVEIVRPIVSMVADMITSDHPIRFAVEGDAGVLPAGVATPLAVVLNELLQNAVDHAYPPELDLSGRAGQVRVLIERNGHSLALRVVDDGVGLPPGFELEAVTGLGLSIVRALVTSDMTGEIDIHPGDGAGDRPGTEVVLNVPIDDGRDDGLAVARPKSR